MKTHRGNGNAREEAERPRPKQASPQKSADQDAPEPERPATPDEEAGQSVQELDEPPQAEG